MANFRVVTLCGNRCAAQGCEVRAGKAKRPYRCWMCTGRVDMHAGPPRVACFPLQPARQRAALGRAARGAGCSGEAAGGPAAAAPAQGRAGLPARHTKALSPSRWIHPPLLAGLSLGHTGPQETSSTCCPPYSLATPLSSHPVHSLFTRRRPAGGPGGCAPLGPQEAGQGPRGWPRTGLHPGWAWQ
jgi:hypothetical protein